MRRKTATTALLVVHDVHAIVRRVALRRFARNATYGLGTADVLGLLQPSDFTLEWMWHRRTAELRLRNAAVVAVSETKGADALAVLHDAAVVAVEVARIGFRAVRFAVKRKLAMPGVVSVDQALEKRARIIAENVSYVLSARVAIDVRLNV